MMSKDVETFAREVGLYVATWSPGDGYTWYRFYGKPTGYNARKELVTVAGRRDALLWLRGYQAGRESR